MFGDLPGTWTRLRIRLVRLMKDHGYRDVYEGGQPLVDHTPLPPVEQHERIATPHSGVDTSVIDNVSKLWFEDNVDTFNRKALGKKILAMDPVTDRVDNLQGHFPSERFFCLVGTDAGH